MTSICKISRRALLGLLAFFLAAPAFAWEVSGIAEMNRAVRYNSLRLPLLGLEAWPEADLSPINPMDDIDLILPAPIDYGVWQASSPLQIRLPSKASSSWRSASVQLSKAASPKGGEANPEFKRGMDSKSPAGVQNPVATVIVCEDVADSLESIFAQEAGNLHVVRLPVLAALADKS